MPNAPSALAPIMAERRETVPFIMSGSLRESPWRSGHVFAAFPARYPNIRAELFKAPGRLASGLATRRAAFPGAEQQRIEPNIGEITGFPPMRSAVSA